MSSTIQADDALPSETASIPRSLGQQESQLCSVNADSSTAPPEAERLSLTGTSRFWMSWEWEFMSCLLVLAIPIIVSTTLYPHSGQPLPQWPFKISINSLLSVYTVVLKVAIGFILTSCVGQLQWTWFSQARPLTDMLHFDDATRGAVGALGLIWRQRFRRPLTALGCIIMVLVVAVDPFVQQLVRPVNCSVELSGGHAAAILPRANVFYQYGYKESVDIDDKRRDIEKTMYDGVFSPGQDPPWECSTGNCTFPELYGTIGVCYSCHDASTDVSFEAICSNPNSSYASRHPKSREDCPESSVFTLDLTLNLDDMSTLSTQTNISSSGFPWVNVVAEAGTVFKDLRPSGSIQFSGMLFKFLLGATVGADGLVDWATSQSSTCDSKESREFWSCQGYGAATCSIQPCVQIYNATISAGVLEEHLVESSSDIGWGSIFYKEGELYSHALIDTHCSAEIERPPERNLSMGSRWVPYNLNLSAANYEHEIRLPEHATNLLENGCLYLFEPSQILSEAASYLSGKVQQRDVTEADMEISADGEITQRKGLEGSNIMQVVYNWGHTDLERVQSIISNVSRSLTTYIRTHGGDPQVPGSINFSKVAHGKVYHYATCLEVQWPWLSFPASLSIFTTLFFLMVAEATTRQRTPIWKVSPLVWVLRTEGLGNDLFSSSDGSRKEMKERSAQIAVHLFDESRGGPRIRMADLKDPNLL